MKILLALLMLFFGLASAQGQNNLPDAPNNTNDAPAPLTATTPTESTGNTASLHLA